MYTYTVTLKFHIKLLQLKPVIRHDIHYSVPDKDIGPLPALGEYTGKGIVHTYKCLLSIQSVIVIKYIM